MAEFVLDKKEIANIKKEFYKVCPLNFIKEMIVTIYGEESQTYAERFEISDMIAIEYKMVILDNENLIKNKNVGDVGCASGLWPILFALHGAKSVIGIEPRPLYMQGAKKFIQKHNLPVTLHLGDHNASLPILQKNNTDTLVLMAVDDLIPNFEHFLHNCSNAEIENYILQCATVSDDCFKNTKNNAGFTMHQEAHNTCLRSGFNPYTKIMDENGFQSKLDDSFDLAKTAYTKNYKSENYLQYILKQNNFRIISNKKPKLNLSEFSIFRHYLHNSLSYQWLTVSSK